MFLFENDPRAVTLLHVEDDAPAREILVETLREQFPHLTVVGAADGEEGLNLFRRFRPDIVLTDLNLPKINGITMAREILSLAPGAHVIVLSGHSDSRNLLEAIGLGIRHYLLKPLELQSLFNSISDCVSQIALQKIVRQQEQYISLLSQAVENTSLVAISDAKGELLYTNDNFCACTGYTRDDLLGMNLFALHKEDPEQFAEIWRQINSGVEWRGEMLSRKKDGHAYWESACFSPITDSDGKISHFVCVKEDITSRRKTREELERNQTLESLGIMAGGIAHDFNNVLTGIMGSISLADGSLPAGSPAKRYLKTAQEGSRRAANLARQLLTFARGGKPVKKAVGVERLVEEAFAAALCDTRVRGRFRAAGAVDAIDADAEQVVQAFVHILRNAADAMPVGEVEVQAETVDLDADAPPPLSAGRYARISFTDAGCGIPEGTREKIFNPYFSTKPGAAGLGLATTHSIIARHGGHISVHSSPGRGTTIVCLLPAAAATPHSAPSPSPRPAQRDLPRAILLMDDENIVRKVSAKMLECLGYDVTVCSNGEQAVDAYRRRHQEGFPFVAAIMDLTVIGGMGGKEAAGHILAIDPDAQLVVSSGYYDDPVLSDYRQHGFCAILPKPYKSSDLEKLMSSIDDARNALSCAG